MDYHTEQLIQKKKTLSDYVFAALIIFLTVILWLAAFIFLQKILSFAAIIIFLIGWGAWYLIQGLNIEFEYELTNYYLDIDKIMGKSRRKKLVSIDFREIEQCAPVNVPEFKNTFGIEKTYDFSGSPNAEGRMFVDFKTEKNVKTRVIFAPNDSIKEIIKKAAPKQVKL